MYVLTLWGLPVACAEREERLNEAMTDPKYSRVEVDAMIIVADVPVLS